jgi:hypothetical protein
MEIKFNSTVDTPDGKGYAVGYDPDKKEIVVSLIASGTHKWFKEKDVTLTIEKGKEDAIRTHRTRKKK